MKKEMSWKKLCAVSFALWIAIVTIGAVTVPNAPLQRFRDGLLADFMYKIDGSFGFYTADVATAISGTSTATSSNTANTIVKRGASGEFSAGTITAGLTGNVTGNVSGSSGSCTGNAATVTNGVYTNGSYTDPSWLTITTKQSLAIPSAAGNVAKLNILGQVYDGGSLGSGDMMKAPPALAGNIAALNIAGQVYDGGSGSAAATASSWVLRDINAAITAEAFYGDGSRLTGISASVTHSTIMAAKVATQNYTQDFVVNSALNGYTISNYGATTDIKGTFDTRTNLGDGFWCRAVNEAGLLDAESAVKLLIHANTSAITDASATARTLTGSGVTYSSTITKFPPNGSFTLAGSITASNSADFAMGTGDFTIESWIYPTTLGTYSHLWDSRTSDDDATGFAIEFQTDKIGFWTDGAFKIAATTVISTNVWTHIALVRSGNVHTIYINGTAEASTYTNASNYTAQICKIGAYYGGALYAFAGNICEFMVTKGVAKYTGNFSVPTQPFYTSRISIAPASGERLLPTIAVDRLLVSSTDGDSITLQATGANIISTSAYPSSTSWVDTAP